MNRLNRKLEYALMALRHMSQKIPGELTTAKEVADSYHTPFDATARVMQVMAQKGLLKSEQGAFGGYQIIQDLTKVNLHQLIEIISGPMTVVKCFDKDEPCEMQATCNIVSPMTSLNAKLTAFYEGINLKDLLLEAPAVPSARPHRRRPQTSSELSGEA
jgi:Rrf2 family transcriptional regulator, nitric oxide-sensitive transcriptional repressor